MEILDRDKIKALRLERGLNQQEAADRAGMGGGKTHWSDIENARRQSVSLETLARIARALGVQPAELLLPVPAGGPSPPAARPKPGKAKPAAGRKGK